MSLAGTRRGALSGRISIVARVSPDIGAEGILTPSGSRVGAWVRKGWAGVRVLGFRRGLTVAD